MIDFRAKCEEKSSTDAEEVMVRTLGGVDGTLFKVDAYLRVAKTFQAMEKDKAAKTLLRLAEKDYTGKVSILCRLLFVPKKGAKFRDPLLGAMICIGDTKAADWPAAPLAIQDGVPFLIAYGFNYSGARGNSVDDVKHCIANCDWSTTKFDQISPQMKEKALASLIRTGKWRQPLVKSEKAFLRDQLK